MSVVKVNSQNFEQEVLNSDKPVVVDFSAVWCGPCQMMAPIFHQMAEENTSIKFCSCDIDQSSDIATKYGVKFVPTFMAFKEGKTLDAKVGVVGKDEILDMVK